MKPAAIACIAAVVSSAAFAQGIVGEQGFVPAAAVPAAKAPAEERPVVAMAYPAIGESGAVVMETRKVSLEERSQASMKRSAQAVEARKLGLAKIGESN